MRRIVLLAAAVVAGCGGQPLTECDQYASRYANVNVDLSKIKEWKFSIGLSDEVVQKLELMQGDYTLRARNLCQQRAVYEKAGRLDDYLCRQTLLDRSADQVRIIDSALKALGSEKEAKEKAPAIKDTLDYYFRQFAPTPGCSAPPEVKRLSELERKLNEISSVVIKITDVVTEIERRGSKPNIAEVAKQVDYKEVLPPSTTFLPAVVHGLANASAGMKAKSYLLIAELYFRETVWLQDPRNKASGLERLTLDKRLAVQADDDLSMARKKVRIQLGLVQFVADRHATIFLPLQKASAISGQEEQRSAVSSVIRTVESGVKTFPSGSLFNFLGTLALAAEENDLARKYYNEGYREDPDHIPIYESLAYSSWRLSNDTQAARRHASRGFDLVQELELRWRRQRQQTEANLKVLRTGNPAIEPYSREVADFYKSAETAVSGYFDSMFERLGSDLAYFSALDLTDAERAQRVMKDVIARRPGNEKDADLLDTQAFVTLRFAQAPADVDEAIWIFERAKKAAADPEQISLVDRHLDVAQRIKQAIAAPRG